MKIIQPLSSRFHFVFTVMRVLPFTAASNWVENIFSSWIPSFNPSSSSSLSGLLKPPKRPRRKAAARVLTPSSFNSTSHAASVQQPRRGHKKRRQVSPVRDVSQGNCSIRPEEIFDAVCSGKSAMVVSTSTVGGTWRGGGGAKTRMYNEGKNRDLKQQWGRLLSAVSSWLMLPWRIAFDTQKPIFFFPVLCSLCLDAQKQRHRLSFSMLYLFNEKIMDQWEIKVFRAEIKTCFY